MKVKELYEYSWSKKEVQKFLDYERNQLIPVLFKKTKQKEKVLDIACGDGAVTKYLQDLGKDVTGIDISKLAINRAKKRGVKKLVLADIEKKLPFKGKSFDTIFIGDNLEHLFDPLSLVKEMHRVLKPKGRVVGSCPNAGYVIGRIKFLLTGSIESIDFINQKTWETEHIRFYNKKAMVQMFNLAGFKNTYFGGVNKIWHSVYLAKIFPQYFSNIMVFEFTKK